MIRPLISVVIPVYNAEQTIEKCLKSILEQEYRELEVICVDDCSSDNSVSIIERMKADDSRIKILRNHTNSGTLVSRKKGVLASTGEYIAFADNDDWYEKDAFEIIAREIGENPVDILMYSVNAVDDKDRVQRLNFLITKEETIEKGDCLSINNRLNCVWNKVIRADVCKKAYDNTEDIYLTVAEDTYACMILHYYASSFRTIPDILYNWRMGAGVSSETRTRTTIEFDAFCKCLSDYLNALTHFFKDNSYEKAQEFLIKDKKRIIGYSVSTWRKTICERDAITGIKIIEKYFDADDIYRVILSQLKSIDELQKEKQSLSEKLNDEYKKNRELNKKLNSERKKYNKIQNSKSYKIGRLITILPRKIKQIY